MYHNVNNSFASDTTLDVIERAKNIKKIGATGAYTKEFDEMQSQLDEIQQLLNSTQNLDVKSIEERLDSLRKQINETETGSLQDLDNLLANVTRGNKFAKIQLDQLKNARNKLQEDTKELENNGTALQEADVQGALNLVHSAKQKADIAAGKAERTQKTVEYAERQCKATENLVNVTEKEFKGMQEQNEKALGEIRANLTTLNDEIPELNDLVCDRSGEPCDAICGGAGCGHCGNSLSCEDGAKQQAESALSIANDTQNLLREKEATANDFIRNVRYHDTCPFSLACNKCF